MNSEAGRAPAPLDAAVALFGAEALEARLARWGYKPVHARRLLRAWHAADGNLGHAEGLDLPRGLRERLASLDTPCPPRLRARQAAADGTVKLLLGLHDGRAVESVLMPDHGGLRAAGCLSSQVGCAMGCDFCATARGGLERNLGADEIVAQFHALRREAREAGRRLQTVVFMGMGEPLHNVDEVLEAVRRIAGPDEGNLGWRQVTVSTVGIVPGIERLAATGLGFHLAVSLHAPDDETRARLLPTGKRYRIADILAAADRFQAVRGRPVTIQYCLLDGINDSREHAQALAAVVGRRRMHVNLLGYNATGPGLRGASYRASSPQASSEFLSILREQGVVAHFRRSRGPDIDAACGQLRERQGVAA